MVEVLERIRTSDESSLMNYIHVLKVLNVFAQVNFQQAEDLGVLTAIGQRFKAGSKQMKNIF